MCTGADKREMHHVRCLFAPLISWRRTSIQSCYGGFPMHVPEGLMSFKDFSGLKIQVRFDCLESIRFYQTNPAPSGSGPYIDVWRSCLFLIRLSQTAEQDACHYQKLFN
jgi:hypothetical protein